MKLGEVYTAGEGRWICTHRKYLPGGFVVCAMTPIPAGMDEHDLGRKFEAAYVSVDHVPIPKDEIFK